MRISYRHGFIALANPRCGSESIRKALDPFSEERGSQGGNPLRHHAKLRDVEAYLASKDKSLDGFYIFTTCRQPWDRAVSIYHDGLKNPNSVWRKPAVEAGSFKPFLFCSQLAIRTGFQHSEKTHLPFDLPNIGADSKGTHRADVFDISALSELEAQLSLLGAKVSIPLINGTVHDRYQT